MTFKGVFLQKRRYF